MPIARELCQTDLAFTKAYRKISCVTQANLHARGNVIA
jgi:hypothetical protein